ncbi:hypothetical protein ACLB2K_042221 [Fragaria x ananassa]
MMACGCRPNVIAYTCMVDVLCRKYMFNRAQCLVENMTAEGCPPNTVTYNTFIKGLCEGGEVDWAVKVLNKMRDNGSLPNITTYNELLYGLFKVSRFKEAFGLVREIHDKGLKLNLVTYNTILNGFCCAGMTNEAMQVFGNMLKCGTKTDAITYNILIYFFCKQGRIKTAIQLFNSSGAVKEWCPDVITYTSLLWGICSSVGLDEAMVYLHKMISEGISPNIGTWNVLVQCFFSSLGHLGPIYILDEILRDTERSHANLDFEHMPPQPRCFPEQSNEDYQLSVTLNNI